MPSPIAFSMSVPSRRAALLRAMARTSRSQIVRGLVAAVMVAPTVLQATSARAEVQRPIQTTAQGAISAAAQTATQAVPTTLGVRFREINQQEYRGCMLNFRSLLKNPPDLPGASLIVDGSLAYAVPQNDEPPRIGLSVTFSEEAQRAMKPLPSVALAYVQTSDGSTGDSVAERVPGTPSSVSSFAFGVDQSSGRVVQDLRNGQGFTLMYRMEPDGEDRALPIDTSISDSTFFNGKLIRYPSPQAMRSFAKCIDKLDPATTQADERPATPRSPQEASTTSSGFAHWLKQYSPFPSARAASPE
jgi:hypothetical protein